MVSTGGSSAVVELTDEEEDKGEVPERTVLDANKVTMLVGEVCTASCCDKSVSFVRSVISMVVSIVTSSVVAVAAKRAEVEHLEALRGSLDEEHFGALGVYKVGFTGTVGQRGFSHQWHIVGSLMGQYQGVVASVCKGNMTLFSWTPWSH